MMTLIRNAAAVALLGLGLAACAEAPAPEDHYYRLDVGRPAAAAAPLLDGTLQVDRFSVDGLLGRSQIVYVTNDASHELHSYHYHYWTEPPEILLQDALIGYLRAGNAATHVVTPEMRVDADYVLTGKIKRFEQIAGKAPKVAVELEVSVRRDADGKLVYLADETAEAAAKSETVGDGVDATNVALADLYGRILAGLKAAR